jgi:hypothetical protein
LRRWPDRRLALNIDDADGHAEEDASALNDIALGEGLMG